MVRPDATNVPRADRKSPAETAGRDGQFLRTISYHHPILPTKDRSEDGPVHAMAGLMWSALERRCRTTFALAALTAWLLVLGSISVTAHATVADDQIRSRIERWLSDEQPASVTVRVRDGRVILQGAVLNAWAKRQTFEYVRRLDGVRAVTSKLVVRPRANDAHIADDVKRRLQNYAFYTMYESVDVAVRSGRVTLTGKVMVDDSIRAMANLAAQVDGVTEVANMIGTFVVSPIDDAIRYEIADRLFARSMFFGNGPDGDSPLRIIVERGHACLMGVVDSEDERNAADIVARSVRNVVDVENKLVLIGASTCSTHLPDITRSCAKRSIHDYESARGHAD